MEILILSLFVIFIRVALLFRMRDKFNCGMTGDSSVHLQIIKSLQARNEEIKIDNYLIPNVFSYPILFHKYCSFFEFGTLKKHSYLPNLLLYCLFLILYVCYLSYLNQTYFQFDYWVEFCLVFFCLAVGNLTSVGPSVAYFNLSARLLGRFSASFFCFDAIFWPFTRRHSECFLERNHGFCSTKFFNICSSIYFIFCTSLFASLVKLAAFGRNFSWLLGECGYH